MKAVEIVPPNRRLEGAARPPGSKSITNRALLLAGMARGTSHLTGALASDDTRYMAQALREMGVSVDAPDDTQFVVRGEGRLAAPVGPLFLGNAGTAMRFLTAAAALVDGPVTLDGDAHMRRRPIGPLVQALKALGVEVEAQAGGLPPVTVHGRGGFDGGRVEIDASLSSQYVSAVLIAAACARGPVEVALQGKDIGARGYIELTLAAMRQFGAKVEVLSTDAWLIQPTGYTACDLAIEPDASAATYFWAAEALTGGQIDIGMAPAALTQPDAKAREIIRMFPRLPAVVEGSQVQDAVPTLAVLAAFNETPVRFTGIANLRVKECDRISALSTELNRIRPGLAEEDGDDLVIHADPTLAGKTMPARIQTYDDHRIAMSFAVAGLSVGGVVIEDPACTAKTFPGYWKALEGLGVELRWET